MRIEYIQISNILSFKHVDSIENAEKLTFDDGLNIIIGENGAGKSTALEVINFLFRRVIYRQFSFNPDLFERRRTLSASDRKQVLLPSQQNDHGGFRLEPNWASETSSQIIRISIKIDEIDKNNITNIRENFGRLSEASSIYSSYNFNMNDSVKDIYKIDVILNRIKNTFSVKEKDGHDDFGFLYLRDYNFFKEAILINNIINVDSLIEPLFESFTLIGIYRNYYAFQPTISLGTAPAAQQIYQIRSQDYARSLNMGDGGEPPIFALVRLQVAERHFKLMSGSKSIEECEKEANALPFINAINLRLSVVKLRCEIRLSEMRTWQYSFEFYDTRRNRFVGDINSLSAGQKSILHLVLEAYGRGDLKGGVVIIDEPEIHLHYQFQHEYLQVLRDLNRTQNCQYILVTHSESLINSTTISSVRRFALDDDGNTSIFSPSMLNDQKSLIKILDNARSTYAFFAKKIVLVEGETDRYFMRAVIQSRYGMLDQEIAILNIGGKGEFARWRALFTSFGLRIFQIADFDYLIERCYPSEKGQSLKTKEAVIRFKERNPDWESQIDAAALAGIFILREGDLESYLGTKKDLSDVIIFCETKLDSFLSESNCHKTIELNSIIRTITS